MKTFPKVFAAIVLLALLISGCKPAQSTVPAPSFTLSPSRVATITKQVTVTPTSYPSIGIKPEDLKGIQVEFWHGWDPVMTRVIAQQVNSFNQTNSWGIFVKVVNLGGSLELNDAVKQAIVDARLPDIVAAPLGEIMAYNAHGAEWVDQNLYVNSPDWGLSADQVNDFYAPIWNSDLLDGIRYGFPAYRTMQVMVYNTSWAKDLGFTSAPLNTNEFSNQACTAALANTHDKDTSNDGTGGWIINTSPDVAINWLTAFGFDSVVTTSSQVLTFSTPENETAFQFLRKLSDDGCAWNPRLDTPEDYLLNRNALFYSAPIEDLLILEKTGLLKKSADSWAILPFPGPTGEKAVLLTGDSYAIKKSDATRQLAAWLFIRWMVQPANLAEIVKATGSLPLLKSEVPMLAEFTQKYPDWSSSVSWLQDAKNEPNNEPNNANWLVEQMVLQDAFWQSLQANKLPRDIPDILKQLDAQVQEVIANQ